MIIQQQKIIIMINNLPSLFFGFYGGTMLYWYYMPHHAGKVLFCKSNDPLLFMKKIATFGITSYYASSLSQNFVPNSENLLDKVGAAFVTGFFLDGLNTHHKASFVQGLGAAVMTFVNSNEYKTLQLFYQKDREFIEADHWDSQRNLTENIGWCDNGS